MATPKDITSTSTPKDNNTIPLGKQKSTLVPDKYLSGNLFSNKNDRMQYPLNYTDDESERDSYSQAPIITKNFVIPKLLFKFSYSTTTYSY